jgi:hypothetical protein
MMIILIHKGGVTVLGILDPEIVPVRVDGS